MEALTPTAADQKTVCIAVSGMHRDLALDLLWLRMTASATGFKLDISVVDERSQWSNVITYGTGYNAWQTDGRSNPRQNAHTVALDGLDYILAVVRGRRR